MRMREWLWSSAPATLMNHYEVMLPGPASAEHLPVSAMTSRRPGQARRWPGAPTPWHCVCQARRAVGATGATGRGQLVVGHTG